MIKSLMFYLTAAFLCFMPPALSYAQDTDASPEKVCHTPANMDEAAAQLPEGLLVKKFYLSNPTVVNLFVQKLANYGVPQDITFSRVDFFELGIGKTAVVFYGILEDGRECAIGKITVETSVANSLFREAGAESTN